MYISRNYIHYFFCLYRQNTIQLSYVIFWRYSILMEKKQVIKELNYIKGLAILLVFIGHASTPSFLHRPHAYEFIVQLIYSFHMSLFFLVSGFLSYKIIDIKLDKSYFNFIKSKFYRLGVPFLTISFITNALIIILRYLLNTPFSKIELLNLIRIVFLYPEDGLMGALWFLYTLLIIFIISPIILKLPFSISIPVSLFLNIYIEKYINFLSISRVSFFLIYFLLGLYFRINYFNKNKDILNKFSSLRKNILLLCSLFCIISYSYIITNQKYISSYLLNTLNFICGLAAIYIILIFIKKFKNEKAKSFLYYLGNHSMDIYIFSWFFQILSMILITKILNITNYNLFFISNIIIGSLCLPFSIYIIRKFNLLKFLFLGELSNKK